MSADTTASAGADTPASASLAGSLAETVAEAGAIALAMFRDGVRSWNKDNDSPVTEADMAVDRFLHARLTALAPDAGWLSEESVDGAARLAATRLWVVDPIDGTRSFMAGGEDWAVSAALVEAGRPVAAALFAPATGELFTAVRDGGARRNGTPLAVPPRSDIAGAAVAGPVADLDALEKIAGVRRLPRIRSLALRIARVATGEVDIAFASRDSNDWDLAAADLVVQEAGAQLTNRAGAMLRYNAAVPRHAPLICAGARLHGLALAALGGATQSSRKGPDKGPDKRPGKRPDLPSEVP